MKRSIQALGGVAIVALLSISPGHAQFGGGRRGRLPSPEVMQRMKAIQAYPVDQQWAALSFACDLSDSQMVVLRPVIGDAWAKRIGVLEAARKSGSWEDARRVLDNLRDNVDKTIEAVLGKDQQKKLKKAMKDSWGPLTPAPGR